MQVIAIFPLKNEIALLCLKTDKIHYYTLSVYRKIINREPKIGEVYESQ